MRAALKHRLSRHWQPVTTLALMALQIHLLVVPVLHHHGEELFLSAPATVRAGNHTPHPTAGNGARCSACQIVRHNAIRPAPTSRTSEVSLAAPLPREFRSIHYHFLRRTTVLGRAPPLS
ncbi:MAG: hypothetical protein LAP13_13470 [Acidobacteriia bacterium]|nr:hypothetical protein [Terriglobia bacterium]